MNSEFTVKFYLGIEDLQDLVDNSLQGTENSGVVDVLEYQVRETLKNSAKDSLYDMGNDLNELTKFILSLPEEVQPSTIESAVTKIINGFHRMALPTTNVEPTNEGILVTIKTDEISLTGLENELGYEADAEMEEFENSNF